MRSILFSFGGDAVFVRSLSRALVERGHAVDVIHCIDSYRALKPRGSAEDPAPDPERDGRPLVREPSASVAILRALRKRCPRCGASLTNS